MQFLSILNTCKLSDLTKRVGKSAAQRMLAACGLDWSPNIGKQFSDRCEQIIQSTKTVDPQRKITLLNSYANDSDVFEKAALCAESEWKLLSNVGTFSSMLRVPDDVHLPDAYDVLGNGEPVTDEIYQSVISQLGSIHSVDPSTFNKYSSLKSTGSLTTSAKSSELWKWFQLPWGKVSLHSSISSESMDFPVYPEELSDGRSATYTTMPDMLYQYEPWQVYQSSGPRSNTYEFHFHRDMWTGDHRDGMANKLIRFCQANCYPQYSGSSVNSPIVTLYVNGSSLIRGILTEVNTDWSGPLGLDGWYLECKLSLSITEVSADALNYSSVASKSLIG